MLFVHHPDPLTEIFEHLEQKIEVLATLQADADSHQQSVAASSAKSPIAGNLAAEFVQLVMLAVRRVRLQAAVELVRLLVAAELVWLLAAVELSSCTAFSCCAAPANPFRPLAPPMLSGNPPDPYVAPSPIAPPLAGLHCSQTPSHFQIVALFQD